ncbi:hypothetical protein PBY51_001222 [Eleginops maclovinus]|uniref:Basement membrane-specific heparan sulfate proteoglycan core protein n=1 Tax=Eleginops maclovinus TaxID=56733 RepID=A0AAN8ALD5_ELEMC|nr:hypothetical protein PBY51_001222 [Eleginops maclovinus]
MRDPPCSTQPPPAVYYRALVNFTNSLVYGPELEDIFSPAFNEISEAVVDTLESDYNRIPGVQMVSVVLIKKMIREDGVDVFVELDVGSDYNSNDEQIRSVLYNVVKEGAIASYVTSVQGFQFRQLGEVKTPPPVEPIAEPVTPGIRPCMADEHRCGDGTCILMEYLCDNRADCRDMSDENNCETRQTIPPVFTTTPTTTTSSSRKPVRPPSPPGPCRADQATCQSGECIPRDYICDGERDCSDGSDEFRCGTPSPCEPNEFKCKNGRCALKLWRCDGDNDCEDNSDETDCPTKGPGDRCAPEQFECLSDRTCIPASYQCDDEPDCPDRSDEYGCTPPTVTSPPEESVQAARGGTVTFTCQAVGVPTPIITWRLNWGHIPLSGRISMTNENGRGTLTIRDVKEADQGAYTCEAINAKGLVFGIPDGVLTLTSSPNPGNCPAGHFSVKGRCVSCFCAGLSKNCKATGRYRNQISLRFTEEEDFKGVNVTYPSRPGTPPLSSTQLLVNPELQEFQLVDLSRRFLNLDSFWTLPRHFLGNKVDSYSGSLKFKIRYTLARGLSEPVEKPDVILVGNGRRLVYRRGSPTPARVVNQREISFTEDKWQHSNGRPVTREDLLMTLADLDSISIRTIYDNHMVSVALSDIIMETTTVQFSTMGHAYDVEECRCPPGYSGLSCESCSSGFERVPGGQYLGTCAGCNCNGHASACDPISGHCLSCLHNTEGPQCDKCRSGYFGDPSRGRPDDCKPCPCPYYETSRRFSDSCFLDVDQQPTCDACRPGYTGRRCEKCAPGYQGNPLLPNGKCIRVQGSKCDSRGSISSSSSPCSCKNNVAGALCDKCKAGFFHLSDRAEGCLRCFCMGVTKSCSSSTWSRDQVRGSGQQFSLSNSRNTDTITEGVSQRGSEVSYRAFSGLPSDVYYWLLPPSFRGDKVTAYGGELRYTLRFEPLQRSLAIDGQPDVVLQGNGIFLEHYSQTRPQPRTPTTVSVTFRESSWRRADSQPCTREHLLMALADVSVFMIRASYSDLMAESSISDIKMDVAVPHSTGKERALEVEECSCPQGYTGPSCQECDVGYTRSSSGLYLGTCDRCDCNGHANGCDSETGRCLCLHNTAGPRCERCQTGFYGNPVTSGAQACQPCPCPGTTSSNQFSSTCHLEADGQPTCDNCPPGYTGRRCEREEKPSADSCDDPFLERQIEGLLPVGCGAEAVFNFSWDKQIFPYGSGDDDETAGTTVIPSQTLFSAAIHHRTTRETKETGSGDISATPNKLSPRIPPRFTPSPEIRHSSFQHLLRMHLNTFNQRLSMLESNTLDMKDSIHRMEDQQLQLSSKLKELIVIQSAGEKNKKVGELEKGYTDMDARLSRLEGRLEILIDGFTALAQEMNRMKRARHVSRSLQEKMDLPLLATGLPLSLYPTHRPAARVIPTEAPFTSRATVPKSIPTPGLPADRPNTARQRERKLKSAATTTSKSKASTRTTLSKPRTISKSTVKPTTKSPGGRRSAVTAKQVSSQAKPKQVKGAITKFQLEPPSHKSKPDQVKKTDSPPIRNNRRNKAFRSDAPVPKKVQERGKSPGDNSKKSHKGGEKMEDISYKLVSQNSKKKTDSTTKPTKATTTKRKSNTTVKQTTKTKTTAAKKKSNTMVKRKPAPPKAKATTAKRVTKKPLQKTKKTKTQPGVLDLLQLLQGNQKSARKGNHQDGSLHVVLGRLAIPIRIIPDD